jgi:hypothetical protein
MASEALRNYLQLRELIFSHAVFHVKTHIDSNADPPFHAKTSVIVLLQKIFKKNRNKCT